MHDDYTELVLTVVEQIPPGQVATYGDIAQIVGRGGPRQVGHVLALFGDGVPWWRVVRADGKPARTHEEYGLRLLRADKTPLKGDRVDLARARFRVDGAAADLRLGVPPDHNATRHRAGFTLRADL